MHSDRHIQLLESRTIWLLREAYARVRPLCLLWSVGKDSNALLWLARKAFFGRVPFPVVQLDTGLELDEVYEFRDRIAAEWKLDLRIEPCPPEPADPALPPASRAAARKTCGLQALIAREGYRGVLVGIRRDEQATRAKERVFSPRGPDGAWDVRNQPAEFWDLFETSVPEGGHLRIHPLLDWTELDIWRYIRDEHVDLPSLYYAHRRPVVERDGMLLAHTRFLTLLPGETPRESLVRFRTVGDATCTGCVESAAATVEEVVAEVAASRVTERGATRADDRISDTGMEDRKREGYF